MKTARPKPRVQAIRIARPPARKLFLQRVGPQSPALFIVQASPNLRLQSKFQTNLHEYHFGFINVCELLFAVSHLHNNGPPRTYLVKFLSSWVRTVPKRILFSSRAGLKIVTGDSLLLVVSSIQVNPNTTLLLSVAAA
jgi:hypothetical protein